MREWELSYRLGRWKQKPVNSGFDSNACPGVLNPDPLVLLLLLRELLLRAAKAQAKSKSKHEQNMLMADQQGQNPRESGELSRRHQKKVSLPHSQTFQNILKKRQKNNIDVYLRFMEKMCEKQKRYKPIEIQVDGQVKKRYQDEKTQKILYLENHRILPGYENGDYTESNVVLLTFAEHVMAHHLRYLQYGNIKDLQASNLMLSDSDEEIRRKKASFAGQIGGKRQQESLRAEKRGWFNSKAQQQRGRKGAKTARQRGVGAFDPQNLEKANEAWKKRYDSDTDFRKKNQLNLSIGTVQRFGIQVTYFYENNEPTKSVRYTAPYISFSTTTGIQYTEERLHMSEDFFWYHVHFAEKPSKQYECRVESEKMTNLED